MNEESSSFSLLLLKPENSNFAAGRLSFWTPVFLTFFTKKNKNKDMLRRSKRSSSSYYLRRRIALAAKAAKGEQSRCGIVGRSSSCSCSRFLTTGGIDDGEDDHDASTSSSSSTTLIKKRINDEYVDTEAAMERTRMKAAALKAAGLKAESMTVFDREVKRAHRDRAAYLQRKKKEEKEKKSSSSEGDFLLEEATRRVLDRLDDIKRPFKRILVIGGATVSTVKQLLEKRRDVETIIACDSSEATLLLVKDIVGDAPKRKFDGFPVEIKYVQAFEDDLPIKDNVVDCVLSVLGLHWVNDLPGAMGQARCTLVPDGLFLSAIFGGDTLTELRIACALAETENEGGVSARVSPLAHVRDAGNLLGRAGLRLPAVDVDTLTLNYKTPMDLVEHLRMMGEQNAVIERRQTIKRSTMELANQKYVENFSALSLSNDDDASMPKPSSSESGISATFQILYMTGWSPSETQQKAKERGSATVSLSDLKSALEEKEEEEEKK